MDDWKPGNARCAVRWAALRRRASRRTYCGQGQVRSRQGLSALTHFSDKLFQGWLWVLGLSADIIGRDPKIEEPILSYSNCVPCSGHLREASIKAEQQELRALHN